MFDRDFFFRPATSVAPELLGAVVHHGDVALRITEVEAYLGDTDPGSHAFRTQSPRNATMFGEPGHLYVYLSYGIHHCVNLVCSPGGVASAVLLRAGEIVAGVAIARDRRPSATDDIDLARGPGRLAAALGLTRAHDGFDLFAAADRAKTTDLFTAPDLSTAAEPSETGLHAAAIYLEFPDADPPVFASGPRTGVSGAGGGAAFPWRFWIPGEPTVSPYRAHVPRR